MNRWSVTPAFEVTMDTCTQSTARKTVLLISYYFPPNTAVGGLRIANFAKYLPSHGWHTFVLTIKDQYLTERDESRLTGIPGKIYKAGRNPRILDIYVRLKQAYARLRHRPSPAGQHACVNQNENGSSEALLKRIKRYIMSVVMIPDTERSWILPATIRAIRIIKKERVDCVLTSGPPFSDHIIGYLAKIATGVRWVMDYRDPWMTFCSSPDTDIATCQPVISIDRTIEQRLVRKADLVLTTTENLCSKFRTFFPDQNPDKFITIANGFDPDIFRKLKPLKKYELFTITHAGTLYFGRTPEPLFHAVRDLLQQRKVLAHDIRIKLIGNCRNANGRPVTELIKQYKLDGVVEIIDTVPYVRALEITRQSHIALVLAPHQPDQIPAKVYDYMGCGTPVLALTHEGATADVIRSAGTGASFDPDDVPGIKQFIYESFTNRNRDAGKESGRIVERFSRELQIERLSEHLKKITENTVSTLSLHCSS